MTRKIIQIVAIPPNDAVAQVTQALCDDGTVWETFYTPEDEAWSEWTALPPIPQYDPEEEVDEDEDEDEDEVDEE